MKNITVLSGQSLFDISIQYTGDVMNAFAIALENGKSVTDNLLVGESLVIPEGIKTATKELKYLSSLEIFPATGITGDQEYLTTQSFGIGTMVIEKTFIVS